MAYIPCHGVDFKPSDHVFVRSALAVAFTYRRATVTLHLFRGVPAAGSDEFFIITDASDFDVARRMGVNYAPKLANAIGSAGVQEVTLTGGVIHFKGDVNFSPTYQVLAGPPPTYFPPKVATPGAVADATWSSIVALPDGLLLNAEIVANNSGVHDRVKSINVKNREVTLSILDGVQGGRQYFYHLVTDASAAIPAVSEKGVYAPRLAKIPAFGQSLPGEKSALLGFCPVLNGRTDEGSGQDAGFSKALANGIGSINAFLTPPENDDAARTNNYSPPMGWACEHADCTRHQRRESPSHSFDG